MAEEGFEDVWKGLPYHLTWAWKDGRLSIRMGTCWGKGKNCGKKPKTITKNKRRIKINYLQGTWVAQSVKHLTLDVGSGCDHTVCEFEPCIRLCADSSEPGACFRFCVSLSLCPSPTRAPSLSQKWINIKKLKTKITCVSCVPPTECDERGT